MVNISKHLMAATLVISVFGVPAIAADPVVESDPLGLYLGLHAGYGWGEADAEGDVADIDGFVGGALVGFNHRVDNFMFGLEADIGFSGIDGQDFNAADLSYDLEMNSHLRARLGMNLESFTLFLAGGLAAGRFEVTEQAGPGDTKTLLGLTIGGGVDMAVSENFTVRAEYLYDDYGSSNFNVYGGTEVDFHVHTVRAAAILNF